LSFILRVNRSEDALARSRRLAFVISGR